MNTLVTLVLLPFLVSSVYGSDCSDYLQLESDRLHTSEKEVQFSGTDEDGNPVSLTIEMNLLQKVLFRVGGKQKFFVHRFSLVKNEAQVEMDAFYQSIMNKWPGKISVIVHLDNGDTIQIQDRLQRIPETGLSDTGYQVTYFTSGSYQAPAEQVDDYIRELETSGVAGQLEEAQAVQEFREAIARWIELESPSLSRWRFVMGRRQDSSRVAIAIKTVLSEIRFDDDHPWTLKLSDMTSLSEGVVFSDNSFSTLRTQDAFSSLNEIQTPTGATIRFVRKPNFLLQMGSRYFIEYFPPQM